MITNTYPGKFIVIEGLDGSGKSAQVELIAQWLKEQGNDVILRSEPTSDLPIGQKIRKILKGEIKASPMERQKLYVEDRTQHLNEIVIPALEKGKIVVASRYAFSTIAYGGGDGLDVDELVVMNNHFLLPDCTIIINVSPEECIKRIEKRGEGRELFDRKAKLARIHKVYEKIPDMFENVHVVNGEQPVEKVFEEIKNVLKNTIIS